MRVRTRRYAALRMSTVSLFPGPGEPQARSWTAVAAASVVARILSSAPADGRRRSLVVGIDGRSGSGKTRMAELLSGELVDAQIVHTDDVAWYESMFGWDHLLAQHVLRPLRNGVDVCYRPPAWERRNRPGAIVAAATRRFTIVEGCGSIRQSLSPLLDYRIWVQADQTEAERRGISRDGGTAAAADFSREWEAQELPFFAVDRPWERADLLVCGTPPRDLAVGLV